MQEHHSRPEQKSAGVKDVLEAHPYVGMKPHEQVQRYRVSLIASITPKPHYEAICAFHQAGIARLSRLT